jgi:hypothetical protein
MPTMLIVIFLGVILAIGKSIIVAAIQSIDRDRSHRGLHFPTPSTGRRRHSLVSDTIILTANFRNRFPSDTRVAFCLIPGPVFVLWHEGEPESSDQSIRLLQLA